MRKQLNSYERYGGELTNEDTLYMENVFYSPLRDSCLYTSDLITDSKKFNSIFHELEITDFFTKEVIYSKICVRGTSDKELKCSEEFESKIKELK